mmetsp:Transcript_91814/g.262558  ORF Transcript_91814/g.262558 Transcript_91814/m.262558 type:complete len:118 (+) Transcript_91814:510-863(+)
MGTFLEVKRRDYFQLEGNPNIFCYPYYLKDVKDRKEKAGVEKLWVIGKTLNDPNGFWIGACDSIDDGPTAVRKWATHQLGRTQWIHQRGVSAVPPQMAKATNSESNRSHRRSQSAGF